MKEHEVFRLLKNYHAERVGIKKLLACMVEDGNAVFYPTGGNYGDRVQTQFDPGSYLDKMLRKCEQERHFYRDTLAEIKIKSDQLDELMRAVSRLPGEDKIVIIDTLIGGESVTAFAERTGQVERTVIRQRKRAVERIAYAMNKKKIETV